MISFPLLINGDGSWKEPSGPFQRKTCAMKEQSITLPLLTSSRARCTFYTKIFNCGNLFPPPNPKDPWAIRHCLQILASMTQAQIDVILRLHSWNGIFVPEFIIF